MGAKVERWVQLSWRDRCLGWRDGWLLARFKKWLAKLLGMAKLQGWVAKLLGMCG